MKEATYEDWQKNPTPRMMWVWDDKVGDKVKRKVIYFNENKHAHYHIIALSENSDMSVGYKHCAEIEYQRRMTNKELSWWLQDGIKDGKHREIKYGCKRDDVEVECQYTYLDSKCNDAVPIGFLIRENGGKWHEPLVETDEYKDYLESEKAYNDGV